MRPSTLLAILACFVLASPVCAAADKAPEKKTDRDIDAARTPVTVTITIDGVSKTFEVFIAKKKDHQTLLAALKERGYKKPTAQEHDMFSEIGEKFFSSFLSPMKVVFAAEVPAKPPAAPPSK